MPKRAILETATKTNGAKAKPGLADRMNRLLKPKAELTKKDPGPLWKGPCSPDPNGGVTYSLLTRFLSCRERFRLYVIEGIQPEPKFNHKIEYGHMWHTCEEYHAKGQRWAGPLFTYCKNLTNWYPNDRAEIEKWYKVCLVQFPLYVEYWDKHPDVQQRQPLLEEAVFKVPYELPSGKTVYLRGKWDSVDLVGRGKQARVWLQEDKTKGDIRPEQLVRQLTFDLQTMLYLTALSLCNDGEPGLRQLDQHLPSGNLKIAGVRYNVVRRPLSGGKGTIVQGKGSAGSKCPKCKATGTDPKTSDKCVKCGGHGRIGAKAAETDQEYYARLGQYIKDDPANYFMRWNVDITPADISRFCEHTLSPILEGLVDWYDYVCEWRHDPFFNGGGRGTHWRHPFGSLNWLDEGGATDLDDFLATGSRAGLRTIESLFSELG